jgi:hypothetical protein
MPIQLVVPATSDQQVSLVTSATSHQVAKYRAFRDVAPRLSRYGNWDSERARCPVNFELLTKWNSFISHTIWSSINVTKDTYIRFHGPGSSASIATDYRLDGSGIECRWGRDFSHTSRPALRPTHSCTMGTGYFLGVKQLERGADHPPPPSAEVENE